MKTELSAHSGKNLIIEIGDRKYARYPIKTHLITPKDKDLGRIVEKYVKEHLESGDIIFIGEKIVSIIQGRSYQKDEIKPSRLARFLSSFVTKTPIGIGLGIPETMQLAVEEVGRFRLIVAVVAGALGKLLGVKGLFYIIAGEQARAIDGPVPYAIPPYNDYVSKGPVQAKKVAENISRKIGFPVVIVDACDFGVNVLGISQGIDKKLIIKTLKDNPLGQCSQQTPLGILREIKNSL